MLSAELDNSVLDLFNSSHHKKADLIFVLLFIFFKVLTTLLPRRLSFQTFAVFRHGFLFLADTPQKVDDIDRTIFFWRILAFLPFRFYPKLGSFIFGWP